MLVPTALLKVIIFCLCGDEKPDAGAHRCTASQHAVQQTQAATSKHQVDPAPEVRQVRLQQIILAFYQEAVSEHNASRNQAIFLYLWSSVGELPVKPQPDENHNCIRNTCILEIWLFVGDRA